MAEGNKALAMLLLFVLLITGILILFNIPPMTLLGIGFGNITGVSSGIWIIILRLVVAPALIGLSGFALYNVAKN